MKKYPTDHRPSFATSLSTIIPTTTRKTRTSNVHVLKLARGCNLHHSQRSQCQRFVFQEPLCKPNGKDDQVKQCISTTHHKLEALVAHVHAQRPAAWTDFPPLCKRLPFASSHQGSAKKNDKSRARYGHKSSARQSCAGHVQQLSHRIRRIHVGTHAAK